MVFSRISNYAMHMKLTIMLQNIICVENAPKYKDIKHQRDLWHGAKIIEKKVISVCILLQCR